MSNLGEEKLDAFLSRWRGNSLRFVFHRISEIGERVGEIISVLILNEHWRLRKLNETFSKVYLVIDGLNEERNEKFVN